MAKPAEQDYPNLAALAQGLTKNWTEQVAESGRALAEINRWRTEDALEEEAYGGQD